MAIARAARDRGGDVIMVLGPVNDSPDMEGIKIINVVSAAEMADKTQQYFKNADVIVLAAAVADYKPGSAPGTKIKKNKEGLTVKLEPTVDIAARLGSLKRQNQLVVGFALETDNELDNALKKMNSKKLDLIVLNSLRDEGAGFRTDTNKVTLIDKNNNTAAFELKSKSDVADDILDKIEEML